MPRTIVIGDIHGCSAALKGLLDMLQPESEDTVITLGDYINRGIDSRGVVEILIDLSKKCRLVPLMGNHEEILLQARTSQGALQTFLQSYENGMLDSYGISNTLNDIPKEHWAFFEGLRNIFVMDDYFFVHANYDPSASLENQISKWLRWQFVDQHPPSKHYTGKIAFLGHTPQMDGLVLDAGHFICLDTGCGMGGLLTAMELPSRKIFQVNELGEQV